MREFRARKKQNGTFSRLMASPIFLIVVLILCIACFRGIWRVYDNYSEAKKELAQIKEQLERTKKRNIELDTDMKKLNSAEGSDYEIRKRLDVSNPGEHVIHIINTPENSQTNQAR